MERDAETYLYELVEEVKRDMDEVWIPYNDECPIKLNNRLSRTLGRCRYKRDYLGERYPYVIEIQTLYLEHGIEKEIKSTICHELIHSASDCLFSGHTGNWKRYAEIMEKCYPNKYIIKRTTTVSNQYANAAKEKQKVSVYKYEAYCPKCGATWKRKSKCELITNPHRWRCRRCGVNLESRAIGGK